MKSTQISDERDDRLNLRQRADALRASVSRRKGIACDRINDIDPIFSAIAASRIASEAMNAFGNRTRPAEGLGPQDFAEEDVLVANEQRAELEAFNTVPRTRAGQLVFLDYVWTRILAHGYAGGQQPDDENPIWKKGFQALAGALAAPLRTLKTENADSSSTATVEAELEALNEASTQWWEIYNDSSDVEEEVHQSSDAQTTTARLHMAEMAATHATRVSRSILIRATGLSASTVRELGLQARLISVELNEWWDDNELAAGELACRMLLSRLMSLAGVQPIRRRDLAPEEARDWLDNPLVHYPTYDPPARKMGKA